MRGRLGRRVFPLIASLGLIAVGMLTTTWGPTLAGHREWALPYDLWGTLHATTRLAHGNIGGIYAAGTGLISLPGAAVILVPCAALISALGLSLAIPGAANLHPAVWLLAGPYEMALSCVTLFAADALAERLGVPRWRRALLAVASAGLLWSVSARWGHPEDAVAVGLLLYAVLAQGNGRIAAAGWLAGTAVCVQPLVLLALPVLLAVLPARRMVPFGIRAAVPSAVLLGAAALANWHDTYVAVTSQPDSPVINHPTAWTSLAPQLAGHNVAAGPFRLAAIAIACLCAVAIRRSWGARAGDGDGAVGGDFGGGAGGGAGIKSAFAIALADSNAHLTRWGAGRRGATGARGADAADAVGEAVTAHRAGAVGGADAVGGAGAGEWPVALLRDVLWWVGFTLALRSFLEPVMVSYYPWPPMAVALIPAAALGWRRLLAAGILAGGLTAAAQGPSHDAWIWWAPLVAGLVVLLALARPLPGGRRATVRPAETLASAPGA